MNKFSPDRWEIDGFDFARGKAYKRAIEIWARLDTDEGCPKKIAILPKNPRITEEEEIANARLIAAAPEMYNWLKEICEFYHGSMIKRLHFKDGRGIKFSDIEALLARIDGQDGNV